MRTVAAVAILGACTSVPRQAPLHNRLVVPTICSVISEQESHWDEASEDDPPRWDRVPTGRIVGTCVGDLAQPGDKLLVFDDRGVVAEIVVDDVDPDPDPDTCPIFGISASVERGSVAAMRLAKSAVVEGRRRYAPRSVRADPRWARATAAIDLDRDGDADYIAREQACVVDGRRDTCVSAWVRNHRGEETRVVHAGKARCDRRRD